MTLKVKTSDAGNISNHARVGAGIRNSLTLTNDDLLPVDYNQMMYYQLDSLKHSTAILWLGYKNIISRKSI